MDFTELAERIAAYTRNDPKAYADMHSRILPPGRVFITTSESGEIGVYVVNAGGFPIPLPAQ